jgi:hypothetical protein
MCASNSALSASFRWSVVAGGTFFFKNFTRIHNLWHCRILLQVPLGMPKVCWCENRTSPLRATHVTPQSVARHASQSDLLIDSGKY